MVLKLQYHHKAEHTSLCQLHLKYMAEPFHDAPGGGKQYIWGWPKLHTPIA